MRVLYKRKLEFMILQNTFVFDIRIKPYDLIHSLGQPFIHS